MIDSLIATAVVTTVAAAGVFLQLYLAQRRQTAEEKISYARMAAWVRTHEEETAARREKALAPMELPPWTLWRPDPRESEERLQRILAEMDAVAHDPEVERLLAEFWANHEAPPAAGPPPVDLSELTEELSERLSEAGYAGGPLRLAGVECLAAGRVVVHLEPQPT